MFMKYLYVSEQIKTKNNLRAIVTSQFHGIHITPRLEAGYSKLCPQL